MSRPGSVHWVKCFEFSCLHPHWGHLLSTPFSHSDSFELQQHHPDTCFVTNVWNVFGYPAIAVSYPSHHTELKCTARTIFFSLKNFFAIDRPQNSSSSALGAVWELITRCSAQMVRLLLSYQYLDEPKVTMCGCTGL